MSARTRDTPNFVIKRDGSSEPFALAKIISALVRAGHASGDMSTARATQLADRAITALKDTTKSPTVEDVQDAVEHVLFDDGQFKALRAYITYREQHHRLRNVRHTLVDAVGTVDEYLEQRDWRVQANANQGYSLGGLILNVSGKVIANYWLDQVYPPEIGRAHRTGDIHIHDLDMLCGYCAGWSLRTILTLGFNGVAGKVESSPPRHLSSAVGQIVNFLGTLQNEWAGAQAFSSFDTYLAPFIRKDNLSYAQIKQCIQELIYNLNVPSRWGTQTPFTNLTFDWVCPEDLREQIPTIAGEEMPFTYGELQAEMDAINRAYIEVMTTGDAKGRVFTFPIPTYNMTKDFPWESENADRLFAMTAKYGLPYFQNFINSDLEPHMVRSMCCRLQLDLRELLKRGNGLFGSAEQTGAVGVVTLNCARLGLRTAGNEAMLIRETDRLLDLACASLEIKRKAVERWMAAGLFPYTRHFLGTFRNHFSTIGVNGINEMIRNFSADRENITTPWGETFALRYLDHIRERIIGFQEATGHLYNLEASPAEGATHRFAREDLKRFPNILHAGTAKKPYYTNSSQLPVGFTDDPFEALTRQEALQSRYTGGTVLHLYLSEPLGSVSACKNLVRRALTRFRLPYITITPTFSVCPTHGYLPGEHPYCPHCDAERVRAKRAATHKQPTQEVLA